MHEIFGAKPWVEPLAGGVARGYASTLQRRAQNLGGAKF